MREKINKKILPNALMIGVDYKQFWKLNPRTLDPFVKAFSLRQEYDDFNAWRQGKYIRMAIVSSLNKDAKYPEKPIGVPKKKTPEEIQEEIRKRFEIRMIQINAMIKEKGGN